MANYIITKTPEFFQRIGDYNYCNLEDMILPDTISYDCETTGLKAVRDDIFAMQIGTGENNYLIHCYNNNFSPLEVIPYLKNRTLVGHNITFDLGFLYKHGFYPDNVRDTFIASKILYNGMQNMRHGFGHVFERELGIIYDKSEQKNIHKSKLSNKFTIDYCFNDVDRLMELHDHLHQKIIDGGYKETYDLHCEYIKALAYMEQCGVPISEDKWKKKIEKDRATLEEKEKTIISYITNALPEFRSQQLDLFTTDLPLIVDLTSPKQMIPIFKKLGINVLDEEFKESIAEEVIRKTKHEFVDLWLAYQSAKHDVTTFGQNILDKLIDGRIYTSYKPILDTARIASSSGDVNTLNLPANQKTRECIEAKPGFLMIVADYEGQETRVGADITGDQAMIDSIVEGMDLHCAFARVLFPEIQDLPDEVIMKEHKAKRNASKAPRFCFQYGGTGYTLSLNENIPIEEGMRIEKLFKQLHSGIYEYGERKLAEAIEYGYIESTMGFKLHLPEFDKFQELKRAIESMSKADWEMYREGKEEHRKKEKQKETNPESRYEVRNKRAYEYFKDKKSTVSQFFKLKSQYFRLSLNNPTQATSAHQTKKAACLLFDFIKQNKHFGKAKICIIPHDEFVLEVHESLVPLYEIKLGEFMRKGGDQFINNKIIRMEAEANSGKNWYEAK